MQKGLEGRLAQFTYRTDLIAALHDIENAKIHDLFVQSRWHLLIIRIHYVRGIAGERLWQNQSGVLGRDKLLVKRRALQEVFSSNKIK